MVPRQATYLWQLEAPAAWTFCRGQFCHCRNVGACWSLHPLPLLLQRWVGGASLPTSTSWSAHPAVHCALSLLERRLLSLLRPGRMLQMQVRAGKACLSRCTRLQQLLAPLVSMLPEAPGRLLVPLPFLGLAVAPAASSHRDSARHSIGVVHAAALHLCPAASPQREQASSEQPQDPPRLSFADRLRRQLYGPPSSAAPPQPAPPEAAPEQAGPTQVGLCMQSSWCTRRTSPVLPGQHSLPPQAALQLASRVHPQLAIGMMCAMSCHASLG